MDTQWSISKSISQNTFRSVNLWWLQEEQENKDEVTIFEENEKFGIKQGETIILPAQFDEMWDFEINTELAIVKYKEKFGFVNKQGEIVIPLMYEDAFDFEMQIRDTKYNTDLKKEIYFGENRATIVLNGKDGVINEKNEFIIKPEWDKIIFRYFYTNSFNEQLLIFAKKEGKYCIFDVFGNEKHPLTILDFYIGNEEENIKEPIPGFTTRLWINEGEKTYYLNHNLLPFAENLTINSSGIVKRILNKNVKTHQIDSLNYLVENNNEQVGVVSSNNSVKIPLLYDKITSISYELHNDSFYLAYKENSITVYIIDYKDNVREIGKFNKANIEIFEFKIFNDYAFLIKEKNKTRLFSAKTQKFLLDEDYLYFDKIFIRTNGLRKNILVALNENKIDMFNTFNLEKLNLNTELLDTFLKTSRNKKYLTICNKIKSNLQSTIYN